LEDNPLAFRQPQAVNMCGKSTALRQKVSQRRTQLALDYFDAITRLGGHLFEQMWD